MNYTQNYQLPQWVETDRILMDDFNDMAEKIEDGLSGLEAGTPKVAAGTYTGNNAESRSFSVGFTPKAVYVCTASGLSYTTNAEGYVYGGLAVTGGPVQHKGYAAVEITSSGFTVYQRDLGDYSGIFCNNQGTQYRYLAVG